MKAVSPVIQDQELPELLIAKDQDEYETLPAVDCGNGVILTRWEVTEEDLERIKETKSIYIYLWTFGNPVQPLSVTSQLYKGK
jgi:hypothetical protein